MVGIGSTNINFCALSKTYMGIISEDISIDHFATIEDLEREQEAFLNETEKTKNVDEVQQEDRSSGDLSVRSMMSYEHLLGNAFIVTIVQLLLFITDIHPPNIGVDFRSHEIKVIDISYSLFLLPPLNSKSLMGEIIKSNMELLKQGIKISETFSSSNQLLGENFYNKVEEMNDSSSHESEAATSMEYNQRMENLFDEGLFHGRTINDSIHSDFFSTKEVMKSYAEKAGNHVIDLINDSEGSIQKVIFPLNFFDDSGDAMKFLDTFNNHNARISRMIDVLYAIIAKSSHS